VPACRRPVVPASPRIVAHVTASTPPPSLSWRFQAAVASTGYSHLSQAQLLHLVEHSAVGLILGALAPPQLGQHIVARLELVPVGLLLFVALSSSRVRFQEDVKQRRNGRIGLCAADRSTTRWACVRVDRSCGRSLEGEPFLEAGAAEGVQAVEQCEGLVEQVGADLEYVAISRSVPALSDDQQKRHAST
jgi:hypothetical protein